MSRHFFICVQGAEVVTYLQKDYLQTLPMSPPVIEARTHYTHYNIVPITFHSVCVGFHSEDSSARNKATKTVFQGVWAFNYICILLSNIA